MNVEKWLVSFKTNCICNNVRACFIFRVRLRINQQFRSIETQTCIEKTCVTAMQFIACLYYWPSFGCLVLGKTNIVGRERLDMKKICYLHAHEPYSKISFILHFIVKCEKYSAMPLIFCVSTSLLNDSDGAIEKRKWGSGREREHRE